MSGVHDEGVTRSLDAIRAGGEHLVIIVRQRISWALDALDEGNFAECGAYLGDAASSVASLATAQAYIAVADGSRLVKAEEVQVGMTVCNVGQVADVTIVPCERCKSHVTIKVGEHEMEFKGGNELYVTNGG